MNVGQGSATMRNSSSDQGEQVPPTLGQELARLRTKRGISQGELARRSVLSDASISRIESGRQLPSLATFDKIADALGLRGAERKRLSRVLEDAENVSRISKIEQLIAERQEIDAKIEERVLRAEENAAVVARIAERVEQLDKSNRALVRAINRLLDARDA